MIPIVGAQRAGGAVHDTSRSDRAEPGVCCGAPAAGRRAGSSAVKREGLVGGATKDATFGKPINPPHRLSVSVGQGLGAHRFARAPGSPAGLGALSQDLEFRSLSCVARVV